MCYRSLSASWISCSLPVVAVAILALCAGYVGGVTSDKYDALTPQELIAEADRLASSHSRTDGQETELSGRAVKLLLDEEIWRHESASTVRQLALVARPELQSLSHDQRERVAQLFRELAQGPGPSFEDLRGRVEVGIAAEVPRSAINELVEKWLETKSIDELRVTELQFCLEYLLPHDTQRKEFSVTWSGQLTPPLSGAYRFSVSPINVNRLGRDSVKHRIRVSIANDEVLDTTPEPANSEATPQRVGRRRPQPLAGNQWQPHGKPVELAAGRPVPIEVTLEYSCATPDENNPPSALLFWEGPALEREIIREQFLTGPDGNGGLKTEYRWTSNGEDRIVLHESPNVEVVWLSPANVAPLNPVLVKRLSDQLFELSTNSNYLDRCRSGQERHCYFENPSGAATLTCRQRQEFLSQIVSRPVLLDRIERELIARVYRDFRYGAEEPALDLVGQWMQSHADIEPEITLDFFRINRQPFWELGGLIGGQLPEHWEALQLRYLEMEDGRCVLPVAYALSYGSVAKDRTLPQHSERGRQLASAWLDWLDVLKGKLDDGEIAGDERVNWLLARAQAAELGAGKSGPESFTMDYLIAGADWLQEAELVVESDRVKNRVLLERIARMASLREWEPVQDLLKSSSSPAEPAWSNRIAELQEEARIAAAQQQAASKAAFVGELQRRLERATQMNNQTEIDRYQQLLETATEESNK